MTELMNLEMVLPAPLNPPFPERHAMDALGRVHFIGIGGAGMSAIAALMLQAGVTVSGSDRAESSAVESLRAAGAHVSVPQSGRAGPRLDFCGRGRRIGRLLCALPPGDCRGDER